MTGPALAPGRRWIRGLPLLTVLAALAIALGAAPQPAAARLARWTGGVDLYRTGAFTTQQTWLWCTAADVQIMRNIVDHRHDHSRSGQQTYFSYMRRHDRYAIPVSDGVDPAGWAAGMHHFVDTRYRLVASGSFSSALRSAVRNLRLTGLPVGITVSHGNHAWILTGFTATADPAVTSRFTVTSVRVVGPLWGLQSRSYGYDMRPDTRLTPRQLQRILHAVALRGRADGLGGRLGVDPARGDRDGQGAGGDSQAETHAEPHTAWDTLDDDRATVRPDICCVNRIGPGGIGRCRVGVPTNLRRSTRRGTGCAALRLAHRAAHAAHPARR